MTRDIPEIGVHTLAALRENGTPHTLLDVREPQEVETCAIADCVAIPMQSIPERLGEIPKDRMIVVMCHHGGRSAAVARFLIGQGLSDVHNLTGGIDAWARLADTTMPRY